MFIILSMLNVSNVHPLKFISSFLIRKFLLEASNEYKVYTCSYLIIWPIHIMFSPTQKAKCLWKRFLLYLHWRDSEWMVAIFPLLFGKTEQFNVESKYFLLMLVQFENYYNIYLELGILYI